MGNQSSRLTKTGSSLLKILQVSVAWSKTITVFPDLS